jgi:hypothetical protein
MRVYDQYGCKRIRIQLSNEQLVFQHMELARRNIVVSDEGHVTYLDWGCSGFYRPVFEKAIFRSLAQTQVIQDRLWFNTLLRGLSFPTTLAEIEQEALLVPAYINETHAYVPIFRSSDLLLVLCSFSRRCLTPPEAPSDI